MSTGWIITLSVLGYAVIGVGLWRWFVITAVDEFGRGTRQYREDVQISRWMAALWPVCLIFVGGMGLIELVEDTPTKKEKILRDRKASADRLESTIKDLWSTEDRALATQLKKIYNETYGDIRSKYIIKEGD